MFTLPASLVSRFRKTHPELRYGQEFHQWAQLEKITGEDKIFCDKLYQADGQKAIIMILDCVDYNN